MFIASKPLGRKTYGSIPHLLGSRLGPGDHHVHAGQHKIACETARKGDFVSITEKCDGSNVAVALLDGQIMPLTRAGYVATTSPYEHHHLFAVWVRSNQERFREVLREGEWISGECLILAHGTRYALHHEPFVAFELWVSKQRAVFREFMERVSGAFVTPRIISNGPPRSVAWVLEHLEPSGHGAIDAVEGAVWRVEREGRVDFLCKYVRPDKIDGRYLPEVSGQPAIWHWRPKSNL